MSKQWYAAIDGASQGPFSEQEISDMRVIGRMNDTTSVWCEGMPQWAPISSIQELDVKRSLPPQVPPPPPPLQPMYPPQKSIQPPQINKNAKQWFAAIDGTSQGPFTDDNIRSMRSIGKIDDSTSVWCEGMPQWAPITSIKELDAKMSLQPGPPPPPKPTTPPPPQTPIIKKQWFAAIDGTSQGPFSEENIRSMRSIGKIDHATSVWCEGMPQWEPVAKIKELNITVAYASQDIPKQALVMPSSAPKPTTVIALAGFFLGGVGYLILGQTKKGWVFIACQLLLWFTVLGALLFGAFCAYDGLKLAEKLNSGYPIEEWEFFWTVK